MVIANPIYDVVFKQLIENPDIARFFIETLLDEEITELQRKPQEYQHVVAVEELMEGEETLRARSPGLLTTFTVFSLNYIATVRIASGEYKKLLIEVRKARNSVDIFRFRNYVSAQYRTMEHMQAEGKQPLHAVTIYLLGFQIGNMDAAVTKVARNDIDVLQLGIQQKSDFMELPAHDSYFIQFHRISQHIPGSGQTPNSRLEELLAVFEQKYFLDEQGLVKEYSHEINNPVMNLMLDILKLYAAHPAKRKEMEDEVEAWRVIDAANDIEMERLRCQIKQKEKKIQEQDRQLEQRKRELEQKEKELQQKEKELQQRDEALEAA